MENKQNLTPELKQIYNRVMETSTGPEASPTPESSTSKPPNPAEVAALKHPVETNANPQKVEAVQQSMATPQAPAPQPQVQVPVQSQAQNMASMAGTVAMTEPRKSKKPLFIITSTAFIVLWAAFWAMFFGLINI